MTEPLVLRRVTAHVFRYPLEQPVRTSFGTMHDRPMVIVEVEDKDGAKGYGEVWCNFPAVGAEHRARLIASVLEPILAGRSFPSPADAYRHMTDATAVLALQCAEAGPFAQAIAGIDTAIWDLSARKAAEPLWRHLDPKGTPRIKVYASGLNPDAPEKLAALKLREGYRAFKLKVGFGKDRDLANLVAVRAVIGPECRFMVDANQAWNLETALSYVDDLEKFGLDWLEEPLRCDRPWSEWRALAERCAIPLAAGENVMGEAAFETALASRTLGIVQPDLAKWGGLSATLPVARSILASGARYCPHYLGGGIGLLASAHLLAAVGGDGALEIDANPNPLRSDLCQPLDEIRDGSAELTAAPGLGLTPDLQRLDLYRVRVS